MAVCRERRERAKGGSTMRIKLSGTGLGPGSVDICMNSSKGRMEGR
jgi:hypothetical protein